MRSSVLALSIIIVILAAVAIFYYNGVFSANHFANANITFDYPHSFIADKNPVSTENSTGYFVCALTSSSHTSAIVIYQIPINSTKNVTTNRTSNGTVNATLVTVKSASNNSTTNNTTVPINNTVLVSVDNLQAYLDQVRVRGGDPQTVVKNNYTYYVSGNLKSAIVNYNSSSRTGNITYLTINETAIVKEGFPNFYVIELLNGGNTAEGNNAYTQIVNTFRIRVG